MGAQAIFAQGGLSSLFWSRSQALAFIGDSMLARIANASRFVARPLQSGAFRPSLLRPALSPVGASRGFAAVSAPKPLSIRMDSLFVKCMIAAVVYFVPQDAVFLTGLFYYWYQVGRTAAPKQKQADAEAALEEF